MVDSNYKLALDSIESDSNLSLDRFKKLSFNKDTYYDELIPFFYKEVPSDIAYKIKYESDNDKMSNDFANQYDELYNHGARNILNNKSYSEEFEYFAPIFYTKNGLPENFIIFRVDGPGILNLNRNNFRDEVLNNLKVVKLFDMTKETNLGQWLDKNYLSNTSFPDSSLDIDFRNLEFCRWNGIDYKNGGYAYRSLFIDDILGEEKEIYELERFITDSYRRNDIVFPNIINLSFLFDDTPSTPNNVRKWSINRYYGFYIDKMELIKTISPYIPKALREGVIIKDNLLISDQNENPFIDNWNDNIPFYIECDSIYYRVERYSETISNRLIKKDNSKIENEPIKITKGRGGDSIVKKVSLSNTKSFIEQYGDQIIYKYRIIADIDLTGKTISDLNNNYAIINDSNRIVNSEQNPFTIDGFDNADIWIIEIDNIYHTLVKDGDFIKVNTDYSFIFNLNDYTYRVAGFDKKVDILLYGESQPNKFSIFRLNLTDIKDFDTNIIDTEYSKFEYELDNDITRTDETKMYLENIDSTSNPPDLDDFNFKNEVVNIPVSSEYIVNYEIFKVNEIDGIRSLSDIWRKNPTYCRWGYQNSLSGNNVPYLLNNSFIFEDFNRTTNIFDPIPKRMERNLDYFYTELSESKYLHHSLHFDSDFDFTKYFNVNYNKDYFSYFFSKRNSFLNNTIYKNVDRFSLFNFGDESVTNSSLFRGIKFEIYEVTGLSLDNNIIDRVNIQPTNRFNDFKLSIFLSSNSEVANYNEDGEFIDFQNIDNSMEWFIIDEWDPTKKYNENDVVIYNDILFISNNSDLSINAPVRNSKWSLLNDNIFKHIMWVPTKIYAINDIVYNNNEYYFKENIDGFDFWYPELEYNYGDVVIYKDKFYSSLVDNNSFNPLEVNYKDNTNYWEVRKNAIPSWKKVEMWNPSSYYNNVPYIIKDEILYKALETEISINEEPGISTKWERFYSMIPDTEYAYSPNKKPIIRMNNMYYLSKSNLNNSTLDNGIIIYINELYKNILININISDNTLLDFNTERDNLYYNMYSKLTAANFIKAINDLTNKYDFTDYVNYVIIDESGKVRRYDRSNISILPYIIKCDEPDILSVKVDSIIKSSINPPIKSNRSLDNGKILGIKQINYFNKITIGAILEENKSDTPVFAKLHGNSSITNSTIYRYSGYYQPIFYNIQLFDRNSEDKDFGNYRFDTDLNDFGIMKERKVRKVNRKGSVLKLDNFQDEKSIYPMLDEFGYTTYDFFIFSSTWDLKYYSETNINSNDPSLVKDQVDIRVKGITIPKDIGQLK